jgi:hypothetical protein
MIDAGSGTTRRRNNTVANGRRFAGQCLFPEAGDHAGDSLGGGFGASDGLGNANTTVGIAGQCERGMPGRKLLDSGDAIHVANVVLRHCPRPAGHIDDTRLARDADQVAQLIDRKRTKLVVGQVEQFGLQRAADKHANEHRMRGRTLWKFAAGETRGEDAAIFKPRNNETESVQRMLDLAAIEAQADDSAARILNVGKLSGQLRRLAFEETGGDVRGDREDGSIELGLQVAVCG